MRHHRSYQRHDRSYHPQPQQPQQQYSSYRNEYEYDYYYDDNYDDYDYKTSRRRSNSYATHSSNARHSSYDRYNEDAYYYDYNDYYSYNNYNNEDYYDYYDYNNTGTNRNESRRTKKHTAAAAVAAEKKADRAVSSRKSKQSTRSQTRARTGSKRDVSESQGRFQSHHSKFIKLSSKALRSSEDIYNRLCLDKELKIDTKSVIIGYKDNRGNSSSEISFKDFVPPPPVNTGNISYNQINYFRTKTKIIWFRQLRFDTLYNSGDTQLLIEKHGENICLISAENRDNWKYLPGFVIKLIKLKAKQLELGKNISELESKISSFDNNGNNISFPKEDLFQCEIDLKRYKNDILMERKSGRYHNRNGGNKIMRFTHFLAIQITNPLLIELCRKLRKDFMSKSSLLRSSLTSVEKLHVTLNVVSIYKPELMDEMMVVINNCNLFLHSYLFDKTKNLADIFDDKRFDSRFLQVLKCFDFVARFRSCLDQISDRSEDSNEGEKGKFVLKLKGLNTFNSKVIFLDFSRSSRFKDKGIENTSNSKNKDKSKSKNNSKQTGSKKNENVAKKAKWRLKAGTSTKTDTSVNKNKSTVVGKEEKRIVEPINLYLSLICELIDIMCVECDIPSTVGSHALPDLSSIDVDGNEAEKKEKEDAEKRFLFEFKPHCTIAKLSKLSSKEKRALIKYNKKSDAKFAVQDSIVASVFNNERMEWLMKEIVEKHERSVKKQKKATKTKEESKESEMALHDYFDQQLSEIGLCVLYGKSDNDGYYEQFCSFNVAPFQ